METHLRDAVTLDALDAVVAEKTARALDAAALDTLFVAARTARGFIDRPLPPSVLAQIVELTQLGPTESNTLPLRLIFITSAAAKERLRPLLSRGNIDKTMAAPATVIVAADLEFYKHFPAAAGGTPIARFSGAENAANAARSALMNAAMQGAYLLLATRALGLDVGPMAGFNRAATDAEFFPDGTCASLWLANIGYGDDSKLPARAARFTFDEIARVI